MRHLSTHSQIIREINFAVMRSCAIVSSHVDRKWPLARRARQSSSTVRWQAMCAQMSRRTTSASSTAVAEGDRACPPLMCGAIRQLGQV
jgi:hypothetical protein